MFFPCTQTEDSEDDVVDSDFDVSEKEEDHEMKEEEVETKPKRRKWMKSIAMKQKGEIQTHVQGMGLAWSTGPLGESSSSKCREAATGGGVMGSRAKSGNKERGSDEWALHQLDQYARILVYIHVC